jgi:hypothetical protein
MKNRWSEASILALLVQAGCASSQGEQVRDARMESIDARADVKQDAIAAHAGDQSKQIDHTYGAAQDRIEASGAPGEDANERLVGIGEERAKYEVEARARLSQLSARINAVNEKLHVLGPRAPTPLKNELQTTIDEYNLLKKDVLGLHSIPATSWDKIKQNIDQRSSLLDERVSDLNERIDDV